MKYQVCINCKPCASASLRSEVSRLKLVKTAGNVFFKFTTALPFDNHRVSIALLNLTVVSKASCMVFSPTVHTALFL